MTRQIINIGSGELAGDGESLRAAFVKTNANFEEIYNSVAGLSDGQINTDIKGSVFGNDSSVIVDANTGRVYSTGITGGAIQIAGNTINTVDSTPILITQTTVLSSDLIMQADIVPDIDSKYNLGSSEKQWKSLYVSNSTIFINNNALSITEEGTLLVNGNEVSGTGSLGNLSVIDYKLTGEFLDLESTVGSINIYTAQAASINLVSGYQFVIQDRDDSDIALTLSPHEGYLQLREGHRIFDNPVTDTGLNVRGGPTGRPIYIYAYGSDGDGTGAGNIYVTNDEITVSTRWHGDGIGQHDWIFGTDGSLTLPVGGTISYTPDDPDNWDSPTVNTVQAALDELAAKVAALENFEIDGGNAYTPAAGELIIDGNGA